MSSIVVDLQTRAMRGPYLYTSALPTIAAPANHSFTNFSKLPPELRIMIWRSTFPGPRDVDLSISCAWRNHKRSVKKTAYSRASPPAALSACRESRMEALKHYTVIFDDNSGLPVYFNFSQDRLRTSDGDLRRMPKQIPQEFARGVAHLKYVRVDLETSKTTGFLFWRLPWMPALQEFTVVLDAQEVAHGRVKRLRKHYARAKAEKRFPKVAKLKIQLVEDRSNLLKPAAPKGAKPQPLAWPRAALQHLLNGFGGLM